jgi:hypothetical protein
MMEKIGPQDGKQLAIHKSGPLFGKILRFNVYKAGGSLGSPAI